MMLISRIFWALCLLLISKQAALSATFDFDLTLEWQGTTFRSVEVEENNDFVSPYTGEILRSSTVVRYPDLSLADDVWGLPHRLSGLDFSAPISFTARFVEDSSGYGPARAQSCSFGGISCTQAFNRYDSFSSATQTGFSLLNGWDFGIEIEGSSTIGSTLSVLDFVTAPRSVTNPAAGINSVTYGDVFSQFTVTANNLQPVIAQRSFTFARSATPPPVPLPGTLVLLPMGLAGLALLKRRRRAL